MSKRKLIRISTIPLSLKMFCKELLLDIKDDYDVLAVSSPGAELDELSSAGIPVRAVKMSRIISIKSDVASLWHLIRLFRKEKPDIVHSITPKAGLLAMMAARISGVPIRIHSFTGLLFPTAAGLKKTILRTTDSITCACATHILPEGEGVKHDLAEAHITRKPLQVLGFGNLRGVDLSYFDLSPQVINKSKDIALQFGISADDFVFVYVGRVVKDKGMAELAQAFRRLAQEWPNIHLLLVGNEEPDEDPLDSETKSILDGMPNIHQMHCWIDDVRPYYALSDALVFPSYREGFPNVVLEAGAMNLPSIVTDINGSREIIKTGINGDIVETKNADALYKAMKKYVSDPAYVASLSSKSRQIIAEKYEAGFVRKCLKDFYADLPIH